MTYDSVAVENNASKRAAEIHSSSSSSSCQLIVLVNLMTGHVLLHTDKIAVLILISLILR